MAPHPRVRTAVIPTAGLGTRMLPASKSVPKVMLPIVDKPVIHYIVEEAVAAGIEHVVLITSQSGRAIEDYFDSHFELETRLAGAGKTDDLEVVRASARMAEFTFVRQTDPQGNGHAVLCARRVVGDDQPFAMVWGDDIVDAATPCLQQMIEVYEQFGGAVAAVMEVPPQDVPRYGILDVEPVAPRVHRVRSIVEKPSLDEAPSNLAAVHAWILTPPIFPLLAETRPGKGGEIWLADAIDQLIGAGNVHALEFEGKRYDAGDKLGLLEASFEFALKRPDLGPALERYLRSRLLPP